MTTALLPVPIFRAFDSAGNPLAGGKLYTYVANSLTPQATWSDYAGSTPNTNPVILDTTGSATVRLDPTLAYKFVLNDANDTLQWSEDYYYGQNLFLTQAAIGAALYPQTSAESAAGVTPTNYAYPPGDIRRYGALTSDATGATNAAALQAAVNVASQDVYIPAGSWKVNAAAVFTTNALSQGRRIYGDAPFLSNIQLSGATSGLSFPTGVTNGYGLVFENFSIQGDTSTLHGIVGGANTTIYGCTFRNLYIGTGQRAIYFPNQGASYGPPFNLTFDNVSVNSINSNGIELQGGNDTVFINCAGYSFPSGYAPYRLYAGGTFIGCNGDDTASTRILIAGADSANWANDSGLTTTQYIVVCIACNFEAYTANAVELHYDGQALFQRCAFLPGSSYQTSIYAYNSTKGVTLDGCTFFPNNGARCFPVWQASRTYITNAAVINGSNAYFCTQGGVSAGSGGPTGTGSGITDGTCKWNYAGAAATRTKNADLFAVTAGTNFNVIGDMYQNGLGAQPQWDYNGGAIRDCANQWGGYVSGINQDATFHTWLQTLLGFQAGPFGTAITNKLKGTQAMAGTTAAVTFPGSASLPSTSYQVSLCANLTGGPFWVTSKTATGFTINAGSSFTGNVDWIVEQ